MTELKIEEITNNKDSEAYHYNELNILNWLNRLNAIRRLIGKGKYVGDKLIEMKNICFKLRSAIISHSNKKYP